jgi:hypothetical protein
LRDFAIGFACEAVKVASRWSGGSVLTVEMVMVMELATVIFVVVSPLFLPLPVVWVVEMRVKMEMEMRVTPVLVSEKEIGAMVVLLFVDAKHQKHHHRDIGCGSIEEKRCEAMDGKTPVSVRIFAVPWPRFPTRRRSPDENVQPWCPE